MVVSVGGREALYYPMIRFHPSSDPVPLNCELHEFLFFSSPIGERGWLEWTGVGYFPSP